MVQANWISTRKKRRQCFLLHLASPNLQRYRSSHPKDVLKICSTFTAEHPCWSAISIKLLATLLKSHCGKGSPVNLQQFLKIPFLQNSSGGLLLGANIWPLKCADYFSKIDATCFIWSHKSNFCLTLTVPRILESCIKIKIYFIKIYLNFYFQTSLWCLKRFYESF